MFDDAPIAFRPQNGGDYPDRHVLADHIAPHQSGLMVHIDHTPERPMSEESDVPALAAVLED